MKLKINHTYINSKNEKIISHTIERDIVKKEESIYGEYYTLKCGWYVEYDNKFKRWEITTLKKGEYVGRFDKEDIKEIKN
jgi:hypothetical protein